jgi:hypothetical protein
MLQSTADSPWKILNDKLEFSKLNSKNQGFKMGIAKANIHNINLSIESGELFTSFFFGIKKCQDLKN